MPANKSFLISCTTRGEKIWIPKVKNRKLEYIIMTWEWKKILPLKYKLLTQSVFVCFQFFWALGSTFMVVVALIVMPTLGWRWMTAIATVPVIIFIILCRVSKFFEKFQMLYFTFYSLNSWVCCHSLSQYILDFTLDTPFWESDILSRFVLTMKT